MGKERALENLAISLTTDFWKQRKVLVTGASGLIGSHLVADLLSKDADVVCLVRDYVPDSQFFQAGLDRKVSIVRGSLSEFSDTSRAINEYETDTVIHLGAQAIVGTANRDPVGTFEANIKGTWNVLEAVRTRDDIVKRAIIASSDKAYGDQKKLPYEEDAPLMGRNPYDCSKSCADLIAQCYAKTYSLPIAISRCGNFFGGGDLNYSRIVPGTIKSLYEGNKPVIRSDGKFVRDYIYVKDAVSAYETLAEKYSDKIRGEAFNFSNEQKMTVLEIVSEICKLMGKPDHVEIQNKANNEIREQHLSARKAKEVLGWKSKYSIKQGLAETVDWYTKFFDAKKKAKQ